MAKRLLALLVAAMMVLAILPAAAFAAADPKTETVEKADPTPKPAPVRTVIDSWDFEEDPLENGWQFLDNDEDGNNWSWQSSSYVHSGSYSIMSASYSGTALTPDNWAMSPWFSVPEGGANLTFWVQNYSSSYPETYSVYFIVYGDEGWNEIALDESVSGSAMVEMSYFIPDTAGLQARIAIRHHDCTDQWRFYIDDVEIFTPTFPESLTVNDVTVPAGRHANVVYEILPEDATATDVTFEIDDTSIATVDANGVVTGVAEGTATITVTSVAVPTVSGTATVTVTEALPTAHLEGFATYDLGSTYTKHFVAFDDADPSMVTDLFNFNSSTFADAYYDGHIYGYLYDSSVSPATTTFYVIDADNWTVEYPGADATNVGGVFAMAYNYSNDTMYGIVGTDTRSIATIDLETGEATIVAAISVADPMTLAIDGEGNAYILDLNSPSTLYSLDLETGEATEIGSTGVDLNYVQSMTWDHETNQLFWAQLSSATDHGLYVIDPETGAATALGTIGASGMEIVGLYSKSAPGEEPPTELLPITEVYVNGYESPVAGEDSQNHLNFTVPADAHYTIGTESYSAPGWWDNDTDLPFYDIFVEGTNYSAGMTLIAEEGYYFADDVVIYVNNDENLVDWTFSGLDTDDNTQCYVWTVPEPATAPVELNDLDAALNAPGGTLHFDTTETYPWIVVEDGDRVFAQSSNGGNASTTSALALVVDLEEAQSIYFEFKAWGEGTGTFWDHCDFTIDGERVLYYGAYQNDWELFTAVIPAGEHTLVWSYTKDSSVNPTGDYFAVDNVSIGEAPDVTVTFVDGIDGSTIDTLTVSAGTVLAEEDFPEAPEHTGYVFDGWDYDGEAITTDTTITAMYHDPNSIIWDFETNPQSQGFVFVDEDGDGFTWEWHVNVGTGNHTTHSGDGVATSASYSNDLESALTPDNWMITPEFTGTEISFWLVAQDTDWADDYLEVYVSTDGGETWSDALWSGFSPVEYEQYTIDLSAYANRGPMKVAFRHFNCTDMFMLNVDDIEVHGGGDLPPVEQIITEVNVNDLTIPEFGANPDFDLTVPDGAHYSIREIGWIRYTDDEVEDLTPESVFDDPNSYYYFAVAIEPEEGWSFSEECVGYINGTEDLVDFSFVDEEEGAFYIASVDFIVEDSELIPIHEVWVDGWGTPVEGVVGIDHVFLTTPDGVPYYIVYGGWLDETDGQQLWSEEHVFIAGHEYSEGCQIWAEEGYYFADDCVFHTNDGDEILDPEYCYVDEEESWICYMNILPVVCEGEEPPVPGMHGDVDLNGTVQVADAILALRYQMGLVDLTDEQLEQAEVNGVDGITLADSILILRYAMGLIDHFPIEG